jgi:hypothetical protein
MSLSLKPNASKRPFVMVAYLADDRGILRPDRPAQCPYAQEGICKCRLRILRWRSRVFGPGFLLCVLECLDHGHSFTVYPRGWPPYARKPIAALDHAGRFVVPEHDASCWTETAFAAAVAAGSGELWPDTVTLGPSLPGDDIATAPCRKTQRRHVAGVMRLFALDATATSKERELVALALSLDLTLLARAAGRIRDGPSLKARGEEGATVLTQLPSAASTVDSLLRLGTARGFWGPALQ